MTATGSEDSIAKEPKRWWILFVILACVLIAIFRLTIFPGFQAWQWEEQLVTTTDDFELHLLIQKILRANTPQADAMLARQTDRIENAVFALEHRVVFLLDGETGQPYSVTRWSANNMSPNISARFVGPQIVENLSDAVTIAVTNEVNGLKCLFLFTYKHSGQVCDLTEDDYAAWEAEGFWNRYVDTHGHPIAEKRKRSWNDAEEQAYQDWKKSMEDLFGGPVSRVPQSH